MGLYKTFLSVFVHLKNAKINKRKKKHIMYVKKKIVSSFRLESKSSKNNNYKIVIINKN